MITRRSLLTATVGADAFAAMLPRLAFGQEITEKAVFYDPDAPVLGNPKGNVTAVEFFNYQCPYPKKIHPTLERVVREDGTVRFIMKDWPVFGAASIFAAQAVQGAARQANMNLPWKH
ncbi:thioredoxin domain-containing protein [Rhizobium halophilum]|uniref:thioredoxin domain-containing protein n=1 Tax=Rhizobium halophilum TaxID=2846852 RepID=UPI001EFD4647|nr:thioredoxin domain-containing protein [Rhizobium halophilum]MCF6368123.1 thioredoxin domain-containing protein [Rhizobium halophilum]